MAGLDPDPAAARAGSRPQRRGSREPEPRLRLEILPALTEPAFQDQKLEATWRLQNDLGIARPAFQADVFARVLEQRHHPYSRALGSGAVRQAGRVEAHMGAIVGIELPQLDEDRTACLRPRPMRGGWRIADIRAGRKVAVLVLEHAVEHEELFAAAMRVRREAGAQGVAHDRGRARHLAAHAIEHAALDAGDRRPRPGEARRVDDGAAGGACGAIHSGLPAARADARWFARAGRPRLPPHELAPH